MSKTWIIGVNVYGAHWLNMSEDERAMRAEGIRRIESEMN